VRLLKSQPTIRIDRLARSAARRKASKYDAPSTSTAKREAAAIA
jgi:hypothetical protein